MKRRKNQTRRAGCYVGFWTGRQGIDALVFDRNGREIVAITGRDAGWLVKAGRLHPAVLKGAYGTVRERAEARRSVLDHLVAARILAK